MLKSKIAILLFMLAGINLSAQNPRALLKQVQVKLNKVKDYSADINIKVDLPYISMKPINTKLYFKQKDKFKMDTKSIAVLPKQGFLQINSLLNDSVNYSVSLQSTETLNGVKTSLVNLFPNSDTGDIVLAKLWIDTENKVIMKSQVTTKTNGTVKTEYTYGSQIAYGLPDAIKFIVDVKKFKIPKAMAADIHKSSNKKVQKKTGEITVTFKNYLINKGIADSVFGKSK